MPKVHFSTASESQYFIGDPFEKSSVTSYSIKERSRDKTTGNIGRIGICLRLKKNHITRKCTEVVAERLRWCKKNTVCLALKTAFLSVTKPAELTQLRESIDKKIHEIEKDLINKVCDYYTKYINRKSSSENKLELYYENVGTIVNEIEKYNSEFLDWFTTPDLSVDISSSDDDSSYDESAPSQTTPTVSVECKSKHKSYVAKITNNVLFILNASQEAADLKQQLNQSCMKYTDIKKNKPGSIEEKDALQGQSHFEKAISRFVLELIENEFFEISQEDSDIKDQNIDNLFDEVAADSIKWFY